MTDSSEYVGFPSTFDIVDNATGDVVNSVTIDTGGIPPTPENLAAFGYTNHHAKKVKSSGRK